MPRLRRTLNRLFKAWSLSGKGADLERAVYLIFSQCPLAGQARLLSLRYHSVGQATLSSFSRLGAKILAEEAYVMDVYGRLDHRASLHGNSVSE